ncbi:hypothetical protein [Streptomyces sp. NBC_00568]|uniref:hypothetical protein n=1 Tax=Streptomyces sp. NBC_00568 TaxID=2975779 RepID=UPI002253D188|nr:hypothetical protein [Streptomyces sp. NBC_00568]MCX4993771.1 hypothetical protein [Streptomyces sp. NBC_00568]
MAEAVLDIKRHQIAVIEADVRVLQRRQRARQCMRTRRARRGRALRGARTCTRIALTAFGCYDDSIAFVFSWWSRDGRS